MKYYFIKQFNKDGKYCSHRILAVAEHLNIDDYTTSLEEATPITEEEFYNEQGFYKSTVS